MRVSKFIPNSVTRVVARQVLSLQKNSPHLLFAAGLVGVVGSTVLACRATLKVGDTIDELKADIDMVKTDHHIPAERNKDLAYVYGRGSAKIVKLYAPSVILGGLSVAALTGSHVVLTRRNTALTAAYATLSSAYDAYRARVREVVGKEQEQRLYMGIETQTIEDENGLLREVDMADPNKVSGYARFFDEYSTHWKKNPEYNRIFLQANQNYANALLQSRGHIFLNEVYDMLGLPRSQAGQVVGWVISKDGDNFIDFGIFNVQNSRFVQGYERSILLDFNVDGVIYDKI